MVETVRKLGIFTKGIVYSLVGILTLLAVFGIGGKVSGKNGVIDFIQNQPFGNILVVIIAVGLLMFAFWRMWSAFLDKKDEGSDKEGVAKRVGYFIHGLLYTLLGGSIIVNMFKSGQSSSSSSGSKESLMNTLLSETWGQVVLGAVALILFGIGIYQFYKGFKSKFLEEINVTEADHKETLRISGRIGFIARGISFLIFGWFVVSSIMNNSSKSMDGLNSVFKFIRDLPAGNILMGAMAFGMLAYGVYQYFLAMYSKHKA